MWSYGCVEHILLKECADTGLLHLWIVDTKLCAFLLIWEHASIRQWIIVTKLFYTLIKSILEVPWVHCNGLYEMNTCSYGSFIKVVTFMRAFCNLIVKSRESKVYKKQNSSWQRSTLHCLRVCCEYFGQL